MLLLPLERPGASFGLDKGGQAVDILRSMVGPRLAGFPTYALALALQEECLRERLAAGTAALRDDARHEEEHAAWRVREWGERGTKSCTLPSEGAKGDSGCGAAQKMLPYVAIPFFPPNTYKHTNKVTTALRYAPSMDCCASTLPIFTSTPPRFSASILRLMAASPVTARTSSPAAAVSVNFYFYWFLLLVSAPPPLCVVSFACNRCMHRWRRWRAYAPSMCEKEASST